MRAAVTGGTGAVRDVRLTRTALWVLAVSAAFTGLPAALAPRTFFDDFPFLSAWVDLLPPYNEHLVTDVGGLFTAFAVLFAWAALRPSRELVVPLCVAWSVSAVLHFAFHVTHLDGFGVADAVGELLVLGLLVVLPAVAVWALPRRGAVAGGPPPPSDDVPGA
jgi:hypothetical protein